MTGAITPIDPGLLALVRGSFGPDGLPLPFAQEIFLLSCHVAGTSHLELEAIEPELLLTEPLVFRREADNPHDSLAIRIDDLQGRKLGYVPRDKNEVLARMMDAGKLIIGRLEAKAWQGAWLKLDIKVYLREV